VAEELGFQQRIGEGGAVDGEELPFAPFARLVDGPCESFFAGSGLALDQHRHVRWREALQLGEKLDHLLRPPKQATEAAGCLDLDVLDGRRKEVEARIAAIKVGPAGQVHFDDRCFVDERSVARIEIDQANASGGRLYLRVNVAHGGVFENEIAAEGAPNVPPSHVDGDVPGFAGDLDAASA
jgi:hypothetical protein